MQSNLQKILMSKNISLNKLSKAIGVSYPTLRIIYDNTSKHVAYSTIEKICSSLQCGMDELFTMDQPCLPYTEESPPSQFTKKQVIIHSNLHVLLTDRNMSIADLARQTSISYQTIHRLQKDTISSLPRLKTKLAISNALNCDPDIIFTEEIEDKKDDIKPDCSIPS